MKLNEDNARIFFLHLPKTGGTTFTNSLYHYYGARGYLREVLCDPDQKLGKIAQRLNKKKVQRVGCVIGHFHFGLHDFFPGKYNYISFLRNPVERVCSLYYHVRDRKEHPLNKIFHEKQMVPEQFFRGELTDEAVNDQTRRLSGAIGIKEIGEKHFFQAVKNIEGNFLKIGLTERYHESMVLFEKAWSGMIDLSYPAVLNQRIIGKGREIEESNFYTLIKKNNQWDLKLYQYVNAIFQEEVDSMKEMSQLVQKFEQRCLDRASKETQWGSLHHLHRKIKRKVHAELHRRYFRL